MEIVTEPSIRTAEQARRYAEELQLLLRTIGVSDADMERGQMRVEANVSLRPRGTEPFGTRVEVKNMNSFRSVERAIAFEIERQAAALDAGEVLTQDTRGWDDGRGTTYVMRSKEDSHDYRYFPEPDLPPLAGRPRPGSRRSGRPCPSCPRPAAGRYVDELGLSAYDAGVIVAQPELSTAFEAIRAAGPELAAKAIANFVTGDYGRATNEQAERTADGLVGRAAAAELADLLRRVGQGELSRTNAREVLVAHLADGRPVGTIIAERGFRQISDSAGLDGGHRRGHRGQPGSGRRPPRRQAGPRLPRRPGHEGDPGPGQRRAGRHAPAPAPRARARGIRVTPTGLVLVIGGLVLIVIGYIRTRGPYARLRNLRAQDENVARYEAWRGGVRDDAKTGASVAMAILQRQVRIGAGLGLIGIAAIFTGLVMR